MCTRRRGTPKWSARAATTPSFAAPSTARSRTKTVTDAAGSSAVSSTSGPLRLPAFTRTVTSTSRAMLITPSRCHCTRGPRRGCRAHAADPHPFGRGSGTAASDVLALAAFAHAHVHDDRRPLETVDLAQASLDESAVARIEEPRREEHERRRSRRRLGAEQDARLLAAAYGVRVLLRELGEECVELAGGDAGVPRVERELECRHELFEVASGAGRHVHARRPRDVVQVLLDLTLEVASTIVVEEVPLVVRE